MSPEQAVAWLRAEWWPKHEVWELEADLPTYIKYAVAGGVVAIKAAEQNFSVNAVHFACQLAEHINERRGRE